MPTPQHKQAQTTANLKAWQRSQTLNAQMHTAAHCVVKAIDTLNQQGFTVLKVALDGLSRPTIRIQNHPRLQQLIESGDAGYYSFGQQRQGYCRDGQFSVGGCRVVWTEVGH